MKSNLRRRRTQVGLLAVLWIMVFLAGALPTWKQSQGNQERIAAVSAELAALSEWSVAGGWLTEAARQWEPVLGEEYTRLFPPEKNREELYLDLARVAQESGVELLNLRAAHQEFDEVPSGEDESVELMMEEDEGLLMMADLAMETSELPSSELAEHRITASFEASYAQLVDFLAGVSDLPRAVTVAKLQATPARRGITVEMELGFYVQEPD
jgi:hypothetical protein